MNEPFLQAVLDHAADGIFSTDAHGYIQSLNPAAARLFGYNPTQLVGQHIRLLIPRPYLREHENYRTQPEPPAELKLGREVVGRHRNGEAIALELSVGQSSSPEQLFYVVIVRDIRERRRTEAALADSHQQFRDLAARLQVIREEERARISREVHDELGQSLTGVKMDLSWLLSRLPPAPNELRRKAEDAIDLVDQTIQTVRKIASELRPAVLDNLGLPAAIEWQAQEFQTRTGIVCNCQLPPEPLHLDHGVCTSLFRIFQETLTNIARHAQASRVEVSLQCQPGQLQLLVRDNGRGIAPDQMQGTGSLGLLGMRERAENLGGRFAIGGEPGHGTWVSVSVPCPLAAEPA